MLRFFLAALHLLALGIGLGAVLTRGSLLRGGLNEKALRLAFRYDTMWGVAALLWISTGLWRYLGSIEKDTSYYNGNHLFLTKMACLALILILEVRPAMALGKWRAALRRGESAESLADPASARRIAITSHVEALLIVIMVFLATGMARGIG